MKRIHQNKGYTLIELFIALLLTAIVAAAGFNFYIRMHNSALAQEEISNMQQTSRATLQEISRTLRMAGYKVDGHVPYRINGDSLYVFYSETQPVDSVLYYLASYTNGPFAGATGTNVPKQLMKKVNGNAPAVFADVVRDVNFRVIDAVTVEVSVQVQSSKPDESFAQNDGFRTFTATDRVTMRNAAL